MNLLTAATEAWQTYQDERAEANAQEEYKENERRCWNAIRALDRLDWIDAKASLASNTLPSYADPLTGWVTVDGLRFTSGDGEYYTDPHYPNAYQQEPLTLVGRCSVCQKVLHSPDIPDLATLGRYVPWMDQAERDGSPFPYGGSHRYEHKRRDPERNGSPVTCTREERALLDALSLFVNGYPEEE